MTLYHTTSNWLGEPVRVPIEGDPDELLERYRDEEDNLRAEESLREDAAGDREVTISPLQLVLLAEKYGVL
jgi:hypothetical protein